MSSSSSQRRAERREQLQQGKQIIDMLTQVIRPPVGGSIDSDMGSQSEANDNAGRVYDSSDEDSVSSVKGDRWDDASDELDLRLLNMRSMNPWVSASKFSASTDYPWSKRIIAMRKLGFLTNEREVAAALKTKAKQTLGREDKSGVLSYSVQVPDSERLTTESFREIDRFQFISSRQASRFESRSLSALAEMSKEQRDVAVMKCPVFPTQTTVGWESVKRPSDELKRLYSQSVALNQIWRSVAFATNEILRACRPDKMEEGYSRLSERRAKIIGNTLEDALHMLNTQIRFTNIRANKSLGVPDDVFAALSRHMDAGRGRVVDSMSTALLERQRKLKGLGASPTSGGAPGGSGKNKRQPSEKRRERSRKKRRSTQPQPQPHQPKPHPQPPAQLSPAKRAPRAPKSGKPPAQKGN